MPANVPVSLRDVLAKDEAAILSEWIESQTAASTLRRDLMTDAELREQSRRFLSALRSALDASGADFDPSREAWSDVQALLGDISRSRARQGFTPSETATFVFSLKQPLFMRLRAQAGRDVD